MCDGEKCDCDCKCGTAPLSGDRYLEDDCGCDPDNCYNEQYPGVSSDTPNRGRNRTNLSIKDTL